MCNVFADYTLRRTAVKQVSDVELANGYDPIIR